MKMVTNENTDAEHECIWLEYNGKFLHNLICSYGSGIEPAETDMMRVAAQQRTLFAATEEMSNFNKLMRTLNLNLYTSIDKGRNAVINILKKAIEVISSGSHKAIDNEIAEVEIYIFALLRYTYIRNRAMYLMLNSQRDVRSPQAILITLKEYFESNEVHNIHRINYWIKKVLESKYFLRCLAECYRYEVKENTI